MGQLVDNSDKLFGKPAEDLVTPNMLLEAVINTLI